MHVWEGWAWTGRVDRDNGMTVDGVCANLSLLEMERLQAGDLAQW